MQTDRFETFMDAILAIIITVLVLKLAQPPAPTWEGVISLNASYLIYGICFLIIFNTWYNDHNLFQMVDEINNLIVVVYGVLIFIISILPYFASWVSLNPQSVPAQTMFGILFLATNACYNLSTFLIIRANPYNAKLKKINLKNFWRYVPVIVILIGFLVTYTVYTPGIFISCIIATIYWFFIAISTKSEIESSGRFEALFDAIIAIILTVLVLEITMASGGTWQDLFDLKIEFLAYIISFIVCFNYWNYNNNLFSIVNKIDTAVIWSIGASMFVLSLIPYLSVFVSHNFYSFVPQACYGIDFIVVAIISLVTSKALKNADRGNVALMLALRNNLVFVSTIVFVGIGMVIGYFFYPPAIIISCLLSIIAVWAISYLTR
ncbi:MAG: TMEM175 family protein [Methanobrevibacter sp.]|uniref:TMEM175 family protein n=1 Tax=Methanobrevibacter sp. TaxID=66852 RepID=UPI002E7A374B|nr:TMEM175 family protein [Methanobrevibacter sp.]MEE0941543.1 TMEM175 family protein [Methanobrevibacter sp.]